MAVKSKTQLHTDIASLTTPVTLAAVTAIWDDMIDSYEDYVPDKTTVQRDALTPVDGQMIYNTDNDRLEIYNGTAWIAASQKPVVAVDCSSNPNYSEGSVGDQYIVSVAGKIGGASGKDVYVGDMVYCIAKNAGGTEGSVGTSWRVCHSQSTTDVPTFYTEISLSSAQILALNTSPQTLISAPGSGKIIMPIQFIVNYTHVTTAYNAVSIGIKTTSGTTVAIPLTPVLNTVVANQVFFQSGSNLTISRYYPNEAVQVFVNTADPTTGDGTMTVGVYYKIHTL